MAISNSTLRQNQLLSGGIAQTTASTASAQYRYNLHPMEQQYLDLRGFGYVPVEGLVWVPIYAESGDVVAVRSSEYPGLSGLQRARWVFRRGREIGFQFDNEVIDEPGNPYRPFPLWLEDEKDRLRKARAWWRFWRR